MIISNLLLKDNNQRSTMGASVSWLSGFLFSKKEIRILILGLVCGASPGSSVLDSASKADLLLPNRIMPERLPYFID